MFKKIIALVFGGCSGEYEISLQSACAVLAHIDITQYSVIPVGVTRSGEWYVYYGAYEKIFNDTWHKDREKCIPAVISPDRHTHGIIEFYGKRCHDVYIDAVFPIMHGKNGEDGTVQGLCELAGIPVIGCSSVSSAICMDKYRSHMLVKEAGIKVPEGALITYTMSRDDILKSIADIKMPAFVKPLRAGSSLGISKINSENEIFEALEKAFYYDSGAIVEEAVNGFEIGCAIIGRESLITGRVDEIEISGDYFDFTEKYSLKSSKIYLPARIGSETEQKATETACKIYKILGCSVFSRVDMFINDSCDIIFNEVNTIPGFTEHSRFPSMLKACGISFDSAVQKIISCALEENVL